MSNLAKKYTIAIDASRNKSGGAIVHILNILNHFNYNNSIIQKIHLFAYDELLNQIPNFDWLVKHSPSLLKQNIVFQLYWQRFILPKVLSKLECDLLFSTSAGSVCRYKPYVTMSRELLSFDKIVLKRYFFSFRWIRLSFLRRVQLSSFKNADGVIFLNENALKVIQSFQTISYHYKIVNHGISSVFNIHPEIKKDLFLEDKIVLTYVSNAELYKNIPNVIEAVNLLRKDTGLPFHLNLVGSLSGHPIALKNNRDTIKLLDSNLAFIHQTPKVTHDVLVNYLNKTDIFIFASSVENMPNTLIEGMTACLPIVCSKLSPMIEMAGDSVLYFNPENPTDLKNAILQYVYNYNLRQELAVKSFEKSKSFSWEKSSKETFDFLEEILSIQS